VQDNFRTGLGEALGDGSAETAGTAGDEGDTVGEGEIGLHGGIYTLVSEIVQRLSAPVEAMPVADHPAGSLVGVCAG
jgi:hypothetical protein